MDKALQDRIEKAARFLLDMHVSVIPIDVTNKKPAIEWKELIDQPMSPDGWHFSGCNIGLITGPGCRMVVVDCDSRASYVGWLGSMPPTPLRVRTKRGMHMYYRHPGQYVKSDSGIKHESGFTYDVKGDRSYVLFPPSMRDGYQYQILPCDGNWRADLLAPEELPEFQMEWRPERVGSVSHNDKRICDGVAYISKIRAVAGQGGDRNTFQAACDLLRSGMTETEALAAMYEWNQTNADPPWTPRELLHKVRCAAEEVACV